MDSDCGRYRDAAAYVLGNLHGAGLLEYRRHLARCAQCQDDVELLQRAADSVPHMASQPPPPIDREPEVSEPFRPGVWAQERIAMVNTPRPPTLREQMDAQRRQAARGRRRARGAGGWWQQQVSKPAMAGVVGLGALAIIVLLLTKQGQAIHYVTGQIAWQDGAAVVKMDGSRGQLLVVGMPPAPPDDRYEVWAIEQGVRTQIPLNVNLRLNRRGEGGAVIPGDVSAYLALTVYAEPRRGTSTPRGTPYVVANLSTKKS